MDDKLNIYKLRLEFDKIINSYNNGVKNSFMNDDLWVWVKENSTQIGKANQVERLVSDDLGGRFTMKPLDEWDIVGMNHYYVSGEKFLFVAMQKDGRLIKEEGKEDKYFWNRLWHKASQNSR